MKIKIEASGPSIGLLFFVLLSFVLLLLSIFSIVPWFLTALFFGLLGAGFVSYIKQSFGVEQIKASLGASESESDASGPSDSDIEESKLGF